MNDELETEERAILAEARAALAPTREQIDRVLAATQLTLWTSAIGTPDPASVAQPARTNPPPTAAGVGLKKWLVMLGCVVATLGVVGFFVRVPPAAVPVQPATERVQGSAGSERSRDPAERPAHVQAADTFSPNASDERARLDTVEVGSKSAHTRAAGPKRQRSAGRPVRALDEVDVELRALRDVERALREGVPQRALSLLENLEQRVPGGQLREERLAAGMVARCALDSAAAPELLARFTAHHPASVYLPRIKQSCTPVQAAAESRAEQEKSKRATSTSDIQ